MGVPEIGTKNQDSQPSQHPFEEWDHLTVPNQTWIALHSLIQKEFQRRLNATAPTAGYHGYNSAESFQRNAIGILANNTNDDDDEELIVNIVATQVVALTYQIQLTQSSTANTS
jgi:hypothetical protein